MAIPADQLPIGEGQMPDGSRYPFFISKREFERIRLDGPPWKYEDARFIPEAVGDPDAIFEGLRRPNQEESFCYSVRPTHDPDDEGGEGVEPVPSRFGHVLLVFVTLGPVGCVVFDWEWREEDPDEPGLPLNHENDFARRAWPQPSPNT